MPTGRPLASTPFLSAIPTTIAVLACAALPIAGGCGGKAHNDFYRQRMANEIRVLEDQLYDADYQNRVLRDKVVRLQQKAAAPPREPQVETQVPRVLTPRMEDVPSSGDSGTSDDMDLDNLDLDDLEAPFVDEGEIQDLPPPIDGLGGDDEGAKRDRPKKQLPPAPGGPEPPGMESLELPEIFEGEPSPPPTEEQDDNQPLGKIQLPESLQVKSTPPEPPPPTPQGLRIHPGLSGGHRFDGDTEVGGLYVVINVVDDNGRTVDLGRFDVDAKLTVVALDPQRDPSDARIGLWEFEPKKVATFVREQPTSGLHVPVRWQDAKPNGESVILHVRLQGEDEQMQCEATVKVAAATAIAEWTPRGDRL